ncbi:MAG TPA: hypothetical protein VFH66_03480 [Mycobacteriales bacterium]|nr:hypothetical protein [Mycobacteriales bacterium]
MRRRLVLLAVAGTFVGGTVTASLASPPSDPGSNGKATACAALDNDSHGQGQGQGGPTEDNAGTTAAELALGCNDSD